MDDSILKIVLMHLMALGAFRPVLRLNHDADALVLMHLMALGAFRHDTQYRTVARVVGRDPKTMLIESKTGNLARSLRGAKGR